jgi:hypothetical protein
MITLNIYEASLAQNGEKRRLLSPCHIQISRFAAEFCGSRGDPRGRPVSDVSAGPNKNEREKPALNVDSL